MTSSDTEGRVTADIEARLRDPRYVAIVRDDMPNGLRTTHVGTAILIEAADHIRDLEEVAEAAAKFDECHTDKLRHRYDATYWARRLRAALSKLERQKEGR